MYLLKTFAIRMYDFEDELDILVNDFIKENNVVDFHVVSEWIHNIRHCLPIHNKIYHRR